MTRSQYLVVLLSWTACTEGHRGKTEEPDDRAAPAPIDAASTVDTTAGSASDDPAASIDAASTLDVTVGSAVKDASESNAASDDGRLVHSDETAESCRAR